ncbi:MAG: hypothetical protein ACXADW_20750 [Candidatus Hodarchaeales archaeon]|jgi:hypothetical protein
MVSEYQIATKIRKLLDADDHNMPEVPIHNFAFMWFKKKPFKEPEFVDKMLKFADTYNFGYITVLDARKRGVAIRFWDNSEEEVKLLKEKTELSDISVKISKEKEK